MKGAGQRSLRTRVARGLIVLGIFMLLTQGLAVIFISEYQEEAFIDQILLDEADRLTRQQPSDAPGGLLRYTVREPADLNKLPESLRHLSPGLHEIYIDEREFHVAVETTPEATYYLLYDATRHEERVQEFRVWLLIGLSLSILLLVWAGMGLSTRLVGQVTDLARRVEGSDPAAAQNFPPPRYRDAEVQTLARALHDYTGRMVDALRREKEFTANVSHELRTPLTTIKTSCELLLGDESLDDKARTRVAQVAAGTERMIGVVEELLLLAREAPMENDAVILLELVEETATPLRSLIESKAIRLELSIPADAQVRVNRTALAMLLSNLLKNALVYTDRGEIRVSYDGRLLTVSDTGAGIATEDLPHVFERGFRGSNASASGSGLGLAIVKRLADRFGWRIGVASRIGEGSSFTIDLLAI